MLSREDLFYFIFWRCFVHICLHLRLLTPQPAPLLPPPLPSRLGTYTTTSADAVNFRRAVARWPRALRTPIPPISSYSSYLTEHGFFYSPADGTLAPLTVASLHHSPPSTVTAGGVTWSVCGTPLLPVSHQSAYGILSPYTGGTIQCEYL